MQKTGRVYARSTSWSHWPTTSRPGLDCEASSIRRRRFSAVRWWVVEQGRLGHWRNRQFAPALLAVGLGRRRPYDLRDSFASLLIREQRTSIVELANQLGHSRR